MDESESGVSGGGAPTAAAIGMALNEAARDASAADDAREYLRKQSRIADLQIDTLQKKDEFELSHLRFRRFSDYARFALEIAGFLVVLLIVCGLATMVWNASQDRDLVVDAFSVPQDVAQTGLTGSVLAGRVLDRFGRMQAETNAFSQGAASYHAETTEGVRVEIPQTGISLGELDRYLRGWLGHEVHITGDLVRTPDGGFALTTRYGAEPGMTVNGKAADLDRLTERSAEQIFAAALPYRHVEYLVQKRRFAEASVLLPNLGSTGTAAQRSIANAAWAKVDFYQGDIVHALQKGREAARLDPQNGTAYAWLGATEGDLGHEENAYANLVAALGLLDKDSGADQSAFLRYAMTAYSDEYTGDFADAIHAWTQLDEISPLVVGAESAVQDAASNHDLVLARRFASTIPLRDQLGRSNASQAMALFYIRLADDNWSDATRVGAAANALFRSYPDQKWQALTFAPDVAYAMARSGDHGGADALLADAPTDCDACMRGRGEVAAIEHRWTEAARAFAIVAARSPHEPFAETDWGAMLLHKGDIDGAIEQFEQASAKGPHFADPLEMWGEALMQKNRSDLALAKFEEANQYAPNWGRLHLKWGEAFMYTGKKDEAQKQFAVAARLDLSEPDKRQLQQEAVHHG